MNRSPDAVVVPMLAVRSRHRADGTEIVRLSMLLRQAQVASDAEARLRPSRESPRELREAERDAYLAWAAAVDTRL